MNNLVFNQQENVNLASNPSNPDPIKHPNRGLYIVIFLFLITLIISSISGVFFYFQMKDQNNQAKYVKPDSNSLPGVLDENNTVGSLDIDISKLDTKTTLLELNERAKELRFIHYKVRETTSDGKDAVIESWFAKDHYRVEIESLYQIFSPQGLYLYNKITNEGEVINNPNNETPKYNWDNIIKNETTKLERVFQDKNDNSVYEFSYISKYDKNRIHRAHIMENGFKIKDEDEGSGVKYTIYDYSFEPFSMDIFKF